MSNQVNNIIDALARTSEAKIVVFGDYALDKYLYSNPANDEVSAETGDNAFRIHKKKMMAGAGGTITNNLRSLGANVRCIGILGNDGEGLELENALNAVGADTSYLIRTDSLCTCAYTKILRLPDGAGPADDNAYFEWKRLDFRNFVEPSMDIQRKMMENLEASLEWADAVIVIDQFYQRNMGAVTDWIREQVNEMAGNSHGTIFYVDSRSFANEYRNMIIKCNNLELFSLFENPPADKEDLGEIIRYGKLAGEKQACEMLVTCGKKGMIVFGQEPVRVPGFKVTGPIDIVGAGDATTAGFVLGLSLGLEKTEAATLGCCVSSITIQQLNTTGKATVQQVAARLKGEDGVVRGE